MKTIIGAFIVVFPITGFDFPELAASGGDVKVSRWSNSHKKEKSKRLKRRA